MDLQLAPVMAFSQSKNGRFLAGGNFFGVIPYEGRYDAQPLAIFKVKKDGNIQPVHQPNLYTVKGQVRDLKWLRKQGQAATLCVASNNSNLIFYKMNE